MLELEGELERVRAELDRTLAEADRAVERTHKQYRRDLVPVRQALARFGEGRRLFERD